MRQFLSCIFRLSYVNNLPIKSSIYLLESLTKFSVKGFRKPFNMMLHQERIKQFNGVLSMGGNSLSTLVKIKSVVKLANNSYHSLCIPGAFNDVTTSFNTCFNCAATEHGIVSFPERKYQNEIAENKNKFIDVKQSQGESEGVKTWAKRSNKKSLTNKSQNQQQSNKKVNVNRETKSNNGVHLVDGKSVYLYNKGCLVHTSHTTGFHNTWDTCVKNNPPFTLTSTQVSQNKMVVASGTQHRVIQNSRCFLPS